MADDLQAFAREFFQDIQNGAAADGTHAEDAFFDLFCDQLVEAGELETHDRAHYVSPRGMRVDGYGGDPAQCAGTLSLIIADFDQSPEISTLTATDMDAQFRRLTNYVDRSKDVRFRDSLEESSAGFGLADLIATRWPQISRIRMFLISNRVLSARVDGREAGEADGKPVTYSVWDLGRLHRFVSAGRGREEIEIDLATGFGGPISALPAHLDEAGYEAYLCVVPGAQLAAIYDRWGARLLEQNVRCFLQARGGVNKGIRNTIENDPEMFFAYNNGITATAESVQVESTSDGATLRFLRNFQIVNGGQTTASIHAASRKKGVDLSRVFVQMKLSVVAPDRVDSIVPLISQYANSQNKVNAADFFANHPYHRRMEEFSRRILAPSKDGTFRESKWFYERSRGQYLDALGSKSPSEKRRFQLEFPKAQLFSKTDLAKYVNSWAGAPHIVSRGAQKNFADFALATGKAWDKQPDAFNESYFKHVIAKALLFREAEALVADQPWYLGGYRANVVTYAIAKIAHDVNVLDRALDFGAIWRTQSLSAESKAALVVASRAAHDVLTAPPPPFQNVTEWAKQQACWARLQPVKVDWPRDWLAELLSVAEQQEMEKDSAKGQKLLNGIEAQSAVVTAGAAIWTEALEWGRSRKLLSDTEMGVLSVAARVPSRIPTERQAMKVLETLKKLHGEGCRIGTSLMD